MSLSLVHFVKTVYYAALHSSNSDMQSTSLAPDKELNSFVCGEISFCVIMYKSYKLKNDPFFGAPYIAVETVDFLSSS